MTTHNLTYIVTQFIEVLLEVEGNIIKYLVLRLLTNHLEKHTSIVANLMPYTKINIDKIK